MSDSTWQIAHVWLNMTNSSQGTSNNATALALLLANIWFPPVKLIDPVFLWVSAATAGLPSWRWSIRPRQAVFGGAALGPAVGILLATLVVAVFSKRVGRLGWLPNVSSATAAVGHGWLNWASSWVRVWGHDPRRRAFAYRIAGGLPVLVCQNLGIGEFWSFLQTLKGKNL